MPKAEAVFQLIRFESVCALMIGPTWYTEHDLRMITVPGLSVEVSAMHFCNNEDKFLSLLKLDQDKLLLLRVQAEAHQVV